MLIRRVGLPRPTKPLRRTELARVSPQARRRAAARSKLRTELARVRGEWCEVRISPDCNGKNEGLHHLLKKSQGGDDSPENLRGCCNPCNGWIEDHPTAAHALGYVIKSWEAR